MAEWISVKERLPELWAMCWVYIPADAPNSVSHCRFEDEPMEGEDAAAWSFECAHYHISENIITHWMLYYTPEPPEIVIKEQLLSHSQPPT